jgi:hypothetical protein
MHVSSKTRQSVPTADDFYKLIGQLAQYRPVAGILRSLRIDPKSKDAWRLTALMVAALLEGLQKLPRTKKTSHKWAIDDDSTLEMEMFLLHDVCGLSARQAIARLAEAGRFFYAPQAGHRFPKSAEQTQRTSALWQRWMRIKKRRAAHNHNLDDGDSQFQTRSSKSPNQHRTPRSSTIRRESCQRMRTGS